MGYRAFTLASSNLTPLNPDLTTHLKTHAPLLPNRTPEDLLFELMLKFGLPLITPITQPLPDTYQAGSLILSLTANITPLLPLSPDPLVLLDHTLTDELKTNLHLQYPHFRIHTV
jgi:hypothetical protein